MQSETGPIFDYLRTCYELDTRTIGVHNFFSAKVEHRYFFEGDDELLNGHLPYVPIPDQKATEILLELDEYSKEKSLFTFGFFALGREGGKRHTTPLLIIPSELIEKGGHFYVRANFRQAFLNYQFLSGKRKDENKTINDCFSEILGKDQLDFLMASKIEGILQRDFYDINGESMLTYPKIISEKQLKARKAGENFKVLPAVGIGVLSLSRKTLGVISELKSLAETNVLSGAIRELLYGVKEKHSWLGEVRVPAILSDSQQKALQNAEENSLSVVIGPPGTGKSFTIANLAVDQIQKGRSVLIVSKTNEAVDVVNEKIDQMGFGRAVVRAGKSGYMRKLIKRVERIYTRGISSVTPDSIKRLRTKLKIDEATIRNWAGDFDKAIQKELEWGEYLVEREGKKGLIVRLKKTYLRWLNKQREPHWIVAKKYTDKRIQSIAEVIRFINNRYEDRIDKLLIHHRNEIVLLIKALRSRTLAQQEEYFDQIDYNRILDALPIWLCNVVDLYEVLPMIPDLFDFVVIDEASQCDLATSMPALQRAKRKVIVGDVNQLRHFSFVSSAQQREAFEKFDVSEKFYSLIDYRRKSLLDIALEQCADATQITFLDEHFRGNEHLIGFSNDQFYNNELRVMKSLPRHYYSALQVVNVDGERSANGINEKEKKHVFRFIKSLMKSDPDVSIGVLSLLTKQADELRKFLRKELPLNDRKRHKLMVGTPYSFQGNERDVMLVSWCIDNQTHASAVRYMNTAEVFNVAMTRARQRMIHFISFDPNQLPESANYLSAYFSYLKSPIQKERAEYAQLGDSFLKDVTHQLKEWGYEYRIDYRVASVMVDILVVRGKRNAKAIDLIGYPGKFYDAISLDEYMVLSRASVETFPLPYSYWHLSREHCLTELKNFLEA